MNDLNYILFLNENPLPKIFNMGSIAGKELRLRAAIRQIDKVLAISLPGNSVEINNSQIGSLEKKIMVIQTIRWPYYLSAIILFLYGLVICLKQRPKLIEAESPIFSGLAAVILGKIFKIPVLVEVRASYFELIKTKLRIVPYLIKKLVVKFVLRLVFSNASVIVANSKTYQNQIKMLGFDSVVINPGLQFSTENRKDKSLVPIIGFMGRLVPEKGVKEMLLACKFIEKDLINLGAKIVIAGDGSERIKLEKLAAKLFAHTKIKVDFIGWVDSGSTLSDFSVLVNPGLSFPPLEMVNVEAASARVPVVCFGKELIPETVDNNKTGIVIPKIDQIMLANGILNALKSTYFEENFNNLVSKYLFEQQVRKLASVYDAKKIISLAL